MERKKSDAKRDIMAGGDVNACAYLEQKEAYYFLFALNTHMPPEIWSEAMF
jgi:hypothetical protein